MSISDQTLVLLASQPSPEINRRSAQSQTLPFHPPSKEPKMPQNEQGDGNKIPARGATPLM